MTGKDKDELIYVLQDYIKLLESELSRFGWVVITKPYMQASDEDVDKGEAYRVKIRALLLKQQRKN